ncbi:hypothetical protein L1887_49693 [Cichorium endivia]|nr:hypothetical protein L1887_49693 [Cichorium endivia]
MGRRLLKMNILQPMKDLDAIAVRQDAVAECIRDEVRSAPMIFMISPETHDDSIQSHLYRQERFHAIRQSLKPIRDGGIDLDKLINALSCCERRVATPRSETERKVGSILSLRTLIRSLSSARAALQNASSGLLQAVQVFLDSEELDLIAEAIYETIDDDIIHAKGGLSSRNAKLVRPTKRHSESG